MYATYAVLPMSMFSFGTNDDKKMEEMHLETFHTSFHVRVLRIHVPLFTIGIMGPFLYKWWLYVLAVFENNISPLNKVLHITMLILFPLSVANPMWNYLRSLSNVGDTHTEQTELTQHKKIKPEIWTSKRYFKGQAETYNLNNYSDI